MPLLLDFLLACLAADAITSAWFYGSIFKGWREKVDGWKSDFWRELFQCSFCLTYHYPWAVVLPLFVVAQLLPVDATVWGWLPRYPLYSLAMTDVVHWLQGERPIPIQEEEEEDSNVSSE